jgi:lipopolysaccharide transport system permease protein
MLTADSIQSARLCSIHEVMTTSWLDLKHHLDALKQLALILTRHRQLTWEMTRRELSDRYVGQVLGSIWVIGHPIILMGLYVFVFIYVFPSRLQISTEMPRSYVTYILAGLIPWMTFSEAMAKGAGVIVNNAGLVKQVVFPLEILPVKGVLASFVTQLVATAILILYMLIIERGWPWTMWLLPVLFFMQLLAMIGVCYILSSVGVYFRDLKEVVQVFLSAGLFLAPILYLPTWLNSVWPPFTVILYLNPFSHLVWCYQDILYFGRFIHPVSWGIVAALSSGVFYGGYRVFRKLKHMFGDVL